MYVAPDSIIMTPLQTPMLNIPEICKKTAIYFFQTLLSTVILLALLEGAFRLLGFPPGAHRFVERIVISKHLTTQKPQGQFRIFTYGESTMHGAHYAPYSSPSQWMTAYLKDFLPGRDIKVVNFSRMGSGSHFAKEAFHDTLAYKPDLAIFYVGHNAFLHGNWKRDVDEDEKKTATFFRKIFQQSHFVSAVYRWINIQQMRLKKDTDDRIEYAQVETPPAGLGSENRTPKGSPVYQENLTFFRGNINGIIDLAEAAHIPILFLKPVGNLKDFAPNDSMHLKKLTPAQLLQWGQLFNDGQKAHKRGDWTAATNAYMQAHEIDGTYADLNYRLGQVYFKTGDLQKAKNFFEEARDYDCVIVRATKASLDILDEVWKTRHVPWLDTEKWLVSESPGGILGDPIIEDNVHFSVKGHSLVGRALAEEIAYHNWIAPRPAWQFEKERPFEEISKELGITKDLLFSADLKMVSYLGSRYETRLIYALRAIDLSPSDPYALRHLAWTYWLMGEKQKALQVYKNLSLIHPEVLQEVLENQPGIKKFYTVAFSQQLPQQVSASIQTK